VRRRRAASATGESGQGQIPIIDDDEHVTRLIARVLRREGIEALSAGDGETGIARFKERQAEIALVVLDLSMPGLSGEKTLAGLRAVSTSVPVLLSSGLPPQEVLERFDQLGADGFLEKPYTARRLLETVQRLLEP
jgi:DNA-binding response OmpR family regulator